MTDALACQRSGDLPGAEALYRQALAMQPDEPDCLHMLGVICHETGRNHEAYDLVYRALSLTDWRIESMRHNMGLVLVKMLAGTGTAAMRAMRRQYVEFCRRRDAASVDCEPLVSVVVPSYNHRRWIANALQSVYRQTYRRLELIVIDDGSSDESPTIIRESLSTCPFPHRFIARDNRGAHATINEGVALAAGEFVNVLNSDDLFPADRIEVMVEHVARRDADWGFGAVSFVDDAGDTIDPATHRRAFDLVMQLAQVSQWETLGVALLNANVSVTTGNLFVRKAFFDALGGFRDFRYNHDWDFCLRATLESEPVFVSRQVYAYRMHQSNTITESLHAPLAEANRIFTEYFENAVSGPEPKNSFAPTARAWGSRVLLWAAKNGQAFLIAPKAFRELADLAGASTMRDDDAASFEELEPSGFTKSAGQLLDYLVDKLPQRPLISVLLPTYNTPARWLHKCIGSVLNQIYPDWELCIADDASPQPHVRRIVEHYARQDPRIKVSVRERNGHISEATNSALALASGSHCALLDHDDELSADALYWIARELNEHPDAAIVYSDEDKIDEAGFCSGPYLKPDWNPDLLRSQNCISHLGAFRTELVRALGGFRKGFEGAQDWDLALRISERTQPRQIRHVPRVLYHWRTIEGSTSRATHAKDYASEAQRRVLQEHYQRIGESVSLHRIGDFWNTEYDSATAQHPLVSLIVDARGRARDEWVECLPRLLATTGYANLEFCVCHDGESFPAPAERPISLIRCAPGRRAGEAYGQALQSCSGEMIGIFSHPSWPVDADWLDTQVGYARRESNGAVAPKILTTDGRIGFAGTVLGAGNGVAFPYLGQRQDVVGQSGRARIAQNFQSLGGGFLLVQRSKLSQAGSFAQEYASASAAQIALCLSLRESGYWNVWVPNKALLTARLPDCMPDPADLARLRERWPGAFTMDPAYHPALSRERLFEPA